MLTNKLSRIVHLTYWLIFAILMVGISITGGVRSYSPIPFWDSWSGELNFYLRAIDGDWLAWIEHHNEHRIFFSRILFWLNFKFFGWMPGFLIAMNYMLVLANAIIFSKITRVYLVDKRYQDIRPVVEIFIFAWLFQWMQNQNLIWTFQSEFFLVQLFALATFYMLSQAVDIDQKDSEKYFFGACALGVLSIGSMANGLLILPLMLIFCLLYRQPIKRIAVVVILLFTTTPFYFLGYQSPVIHWLSPLNSLETLLPFSQYTLLYIGSPFYYLAEGGKLGIILAYTFGSILILAIAILAYRVLRYRNMKQVEASLYFYIIFVLSSALITAAGRIRFGVEQALDSRYTTPALMAWLALFIIGISIIFQHSPGKTISRTIKFLMYGLSIAMLLAQINALTTPKEMLYGRKIGALALAMSVADPKRVSVIYPSIDIASSIAEKAYQKEFSIFSSQAYREFRERPLTKFENNLTVANCVGSIDNIQAVDGESKYLSINGWLRLQEDISPTFEHLRFMNSDGLIVGYAVYGGYRPDVGKAINEKNTFSGYDGYILANQISSILLVNAGDLTCRFELQTMKKK
jgi:hypothetical protein